MILYQMIKIKDWDLVLDRDKTNVIEDVSVDFENIPWLTEEKLTDINVDMGNVANGVNWNVTITTTPWDQSITWIWFKPTRIEVTAINLGSAPRVWSYWIANEWEEWRAGSDNDFSTTRLYLTSDSSANTAWKLKSFDSDWFTITKTSTNDIVELIFTCYK